MKKLFAVLALVAVMTSCKDKKKDEKKTDETTVTNSDTTAKEDNTTTTPTTDNTATANAEIPKFADPEVQKFVNEYSALVLDYKANMMDPVKAQKWAQTSQEWSTKMTRVGMKIGNSPQELQKWSDWTKWLTVQMTPKQP